MRAASQQDEFDDCQHLVHCRGLRLTKGAQIPKLRKVYLTISLALLSHQSGGLSSSLTMAGASTVPFPPNELSLDGRSPFL